MGVGRSICQLLLRPHAPNTFWRFQRHIEIFLDHLGGVDPSVGRVLVPNNQAKLSKYIGEGEGNMSTSIRAPCTKYFWKFLRHIRTFLDYLGDVDPPVGRVLVPNYQATLGKYMGEGEFNIPASIRAPCTKYFLEIPETHRNNSRSLVMC